MKTEFILLHLSLAHNALSSWLERLLGHEGFMLHNIYAMKASDFLYYGLSAKYAHDLVIHLSDMNVLEREIELIEKHHIKIVTILDAHYPIRLKHIAHPPLVLYYKGTSSFVAWEKNIAVVGSRNASDYAQRVVDAWLPSLIVKDWSIISGGAIGVDAMAHNVAVSNQGKTVSVLGSGLLCLYPKSNIKLFERIVDKNGALVSSFPLTMTALPHNFPIRNRIISGLSNACLVVQAAKKSGASITAEFALEQGRMVFAVPGSVFDPLHEGCHALIKEGATLIGSLEDLMKELGEGLQDNISEMHEQKDVVTVQDFSTEPDCMQSHTEQLVIQHCRQDFISTDELIHKINIDLNELYDLLFNLQLAGKIEQNAAGLWKCR